MRTILLLFMALSIVGCEAGPTTKEFLFANSDIKFQVNGKGKMYDLYTSQRALDLLKCKNEVVAFYVGQETYEMLLTGDEQRIGKTKYFVKSNTGL